MDIQGNWNIFYLSLLFSLGLFWRVVKSLPWHMLKTFISIVGSRIRPELRRMISSNHYLGPDGKLLPAHNLLISIKIQGLVNVQEFKKAFMSYCVLQNDPKSGLLEFPELQETIEVHWGFPFWRCHGGKKFDINKHISGEEVFEDLGQITEKTCLKIEQIIIKRDFDRTAGSPWRIHLLHDREQNTTRLLFAFHHSLGDGMSMYGLLMRLASRNSANIETSRNSWTESVCQFLPPRNPLLVPVKLMHNFIKCAAPPPFWVPLEKLGTQGDRVIVKSSKIDKNKLSKISRRNSVPFTAVLLSAITGSLRKYILDRRLNVPDFVLCPMPIPFITSSNSGLKNAVQSVEFTLPFGKSETKERLQACKKTITEAKTSSFPLLVRLGLFIENGYPFAWKPPSEAMPPIILSSFPGPKLAESILGIEHKILDMDFAWNGTRYASVIFTTLTYCDGIRIVLSADPSAFQFGKGASANSLMEDIDMEIRKMERL